MARRSAGTPSRSSSLGNRRGPMSSVTRRFVIETARSGSRGQQDQLQEKNGESSGSCTGGCKQEREEDCRREQYDGDDGAGICGRDVGARDPLPHGRAEAELLLERRAAAGKQMIAGSSGRARRRGSPSATSGFCARRSAARATSNSERREPRASSSTACRYMSRVRKSISPRPPPARSSSSTRTHALEEDLPFESREEPHAGDDVPDQQVGSARL